MKEEMMGKDDPGTATISKGYKLFCIRDGHLHSLFLSPKYATIYPEDEWVTRKDQWGPMGIFRSFRYAERYLVEMQKSGGVYRCREVEYTDSAQRGFWRPLSELKDDVQYYSWLNVPEGTFYADSVKVSAAN